VRNIPSSIFTQNTTTSHMIATMCAKRKKVSGKSELLIEYRGTKTVRRIIISSLTIDEDIIVDGADK
jgi:hypothetical protein